jgi:hypothetical protein
MKRVLKDVKEDGKRRQEDGKPFRFFPMEKRR